MAGINDSADPYFVQIRMVFDQFLEIDGVDQGPLTIGISVDLYGLFDQRQRRSGAQACGGNTLVRLPLRVPVGEQLQLLFCQIPRIVKNIRFATLIESFKLDVRQKFAVWIVKLGPAVDLGFEDQGRQKARNRVDGQDVIERPAIEISLAEVPPVLSVAQA